MFFITIQASLAQTPEPSHVTRHYETARHTLSMVQPPAPHIKSVSFLEVKGKDVPLPCEKEEIVSIQYTIVGETQGSVDIMYLVSRSMRKKKTEQFSYILIFRKSFGPF